MRPSPPSTETGKPPGRLLRFVLAERLAHWSKAVFFIAAATGGLVMWIPRTRQLMGANRLQFSHLHGGIGILMILVPLVILIALDRRRFAEDLKEVDVWDEDDRRWFWAALRLRTLRGKQMPPQGRLNAGQKVNSLLVSLIAIGLLVTGSILLVRAQAPAWLVSRALVPPHHPGRRRARALCGPHSPRLPHAPRTRFSPRHASRNHERRDRSRASREMVARSCGAI